MHLIAKKMVFATAEPATSASPAGTAGDGHQQILTFDENQLLVSVFGVGNAHLSQVERVLDVRLSSSGNQLHMSGNPDDLDTCRSLFEALYAQAQRGEAVGPDDVTEVFQGLDEAHSFNFENGVSLGRTFEGHVEVSHWLYHMN